MGFSSASVILLKHIIKIKIMRISNCCNSRIIFTDICSTCKEHAVVVDQRDPSIRRSTTVHYPDWDLKNKKYIVRKRGKNENR